MSPGPDETWPLDARRGGQTWPLDGWEAARRGLSTVGGVRGWGGQASAGQSAAIWARRCSQLACTPAISRVTWSRNSTDRASRRPAALPTPPTASSPARTEDSIWAEQPVAAQHRLVPGVEVHDVDVAPRPPLALLADEVGLGEVLDRAGHGGRAHVERLGQLDGRHPPVGVGEQLGEDAGREARHTGLGEDVAEPLDVGSDRPFVAFGRCGTAPSVSGTVTLSDPSYHSVNRESCVPSIHDIRDPGRRACTRPSVARSPSTGSTSTSRPGEIHGFLGPNGAGKSTTLRILLGLLRSDGGTATLLGGDPWREVESLHRRLAYVPGDVALWPNLTGGEVIDILARLRGGVDEQRRAEMIERFDLDPTKKGRSYSKGNRQKVALVAALSSDVELLLLDEPTSGLDPLMEAVFREVVREFREAGGTVLLSSHILSEVEHLCDRVSIIREGRNVESGTLTQLRHLSRTTVRATLAHPVDAAQVEAVPGVADVTVSGDQVTCTVGSDDLGRLLELLGRTASRP